MVLDKASTTVPTVHQEYKMKIVEFKCSECYTGTTRVEGAESGYIPSCALCGKPMMFVSEQISPEGLEELDFTEDE